VRLGWGRLGLLLFLLGAAVYAQELSQVVIPSEDELWEALQEGIITYDQYVILLDISENGLDSTNQYLLDEIPNLTYLLAVDSTIADPLEKDQASGFERTGRAGSMTEHVRGRIGHRYQTLMDEKRQSWYRSYADVTLNNHWRSGVRISRERNGLERFTSRSLGYRNSSGAVRRIECGSFTTRFGLGSVFGHRGRIMDLSSRLDGESFVYPDYGGYNGILAELRPGAWSVQALTSVTRDATYRLISEGVMVQRAIKHFKPGLIAAHVSLNNRVTGATLNVPVTAGFMQYAYRAGNVSTEVSYQGGPQVSAMAAVIEGSHRFETAELRYSAWSYDDHFVDFTAGSKSSVVYVAYTLETVSFPYRSRRAGQTGALVRTAVQFGKATTFANSLMYASNVEQARRRQFSSSLIYAESAEWEWRLAYLGDWRREQGTDPGSKTGHQIRLEGRYSVTRFRSRCYIGYDVESRTNEHACLFVSARYVRPDGSTYEVWSNFGEITRDGLDYWYGFVRSQWPLGKYLTGAAKLSHSYRRGSNERGTTQLSLELTAEL